MAFLARKDQPVWFKQVLEEISCHKLHPEYDGFLYNHITHGVIALHVLGADENRIRKFISWYSSKKNVTHLDDVAQIRNNTEADDDILDLMGKRQSYHEVLAYYDKMVVKEGIDSVVRENYPSLGAGLTSGLLHGLIHLGYGCSVRSHEMMVEGLAYLHYAYEPFSYDMTSSNDIVNFGKGRQPLSAVLDSIRKNTELRKRVESYHQEFKHLSLGIFQPRLIGISHYLANDYIQFAHQVQLPDFFQNDKCDIPMLVRLTNWLTLKVIEVFCKSAIINDFALLHGVTGCWSLGHIIPLLKFEDALVAVRNYLAVFLAVFTIEHCSPLSQSIPSLKGPLNDGHWQTIIKEITAADADEHVFKLTQVCYCLWKEGYRGAEYDAAFVTAINIISKHPFGFARPEERNNAA